MNGPDLGDDFGARDLWPFCPWPQRLRPRRGKAAVVEVLLARNGDPDDVMELIAAGTSAAAGLRARVVDPLSWYASRKPDFLPDVMIQAGRRFQEHFEWLEIHEGPRVADHGRASSPKTDTPGPPAVIDLLVERSIAMEAALADVGGPELDRILIDVVGRSRPMADFERRHRYPTGSGQVALRIALFRLVMHYGMVSLAWRP